MNIQAKLLSEFVQKINLIMDPENPTVNYRITELVTDIETCSKLLLEVINAEENDVSLERLEEDFHSYLEKVLSLSNFQDLPIAIEGLAQKFEAFIKKIGFLKYKDTKYWNGDDTSAGILGSTFKNLCDGILSNKFGVKKGSKNLVLPESLVNYTGVTKSLLDFTRVKLRNSVHFAPSINRKDIIPYAEIVVLIYLLTIQHNFSFLASLFLPEYNFKKKLFREFEKWESKYVFLEAEELNLEVISDLFPILIETDWKQSESEIIEKRKGAIVDIFQEVKKLIIVGPPGIGKTTTLQYLGYSVAKDSNKIPIYYPLREYNSRLELVELITQSLDTDNNNFFSHCQKGNMVFLLDGLNEVILIEERQILINEINHLISKYPGCGFAITSRASILQHQFNLPVFELHLFQIFKSRSLLLKIFLQKEVLFLNC